MNERELIQKWIAWKEESEQHPFSQKHLAESAGISPTYLSSILTGIRNAGSKTVERIAGAFGVTLAEFYGGPPNREEPHTPFSTREQPFLRENTQPYPLETEKPFRRDFGKPLQREAEKPHERENEQPLHREAEKPHERENEQPLHREVMEEAPSVDGPPDVTSLKLFSSSPKEIERLFGSYGIEMGSNTFSSSSGNLPGDESDTVERSEPATRGVLMDDDSDAIPEGEIPLLTHVPEGHWSKWFTAGPEAMYRSIPALFAAKNLFAVQLTDDSMWPVLEKGALLIVDPWQSSGSVKGQIAVVAHRGSFRTGRIYAIGETLVLVPANPRYFPELIPAEEAEVFVVAFHVLPGTDQS